MTTPRRDRVVMNGRNYRMTGTMRKVLAAVVDAERPAWGFSICESAGLGSGVVYPAIERLVNAGLILGEWESPVPDDRPRRLFYRPAFDPSWYRANGLLTEVQA
jgi:hypothetical protein